ncbi:uncharacterized protein L3040_006279 [Drepanopeziza brunnea f. sp. 'multigermtubi']|uniref:Cyclin domain-containing protein n=1 Tax=Marssonina brunnea f. sp. multigermtubi (strain MB_m1) TaxID=1072389 RepID=K1XVQ6_MARBU|nr:cyclin domain-containing protein [Drepanopeziza brunnea f. sp. 'multigermtubi' MB_m1]EKD16779.1 cyclin domain-containing protein [Drepanopeziza brunnea f. sp. 'multigermtubi' MB_m1]KAJ5040630.1 hypothetical protein L3040_006279 [Drepanopeziza brunnea f. sp. 'multigermtubi']
MSHLSNPLATTSQLYAQSASNPSALPLEIQDSIRFYTARLTQAAGILLRMPQDITAQANVLLFRYWAVDRLMEWEFSDVSAATLYLTAKISASPRSLRSITNVYAFLLSPSSPLSSSPTSAPPKDDPASYYLSESAYITYRTRLLLIEGQILNAIGFTTHVALPHSLAITYLQTLDIFTSPKTGSRVAKRAIAWLNTALLSPQMLYLTHQPCALATAAVYLACREEGVRLPEVEWWEVFDCEREELGFLVVGMGSLERVARREIERWGLGKGMITREDVEASVGVKAEEEDEETMMARMLDEKVKEEV